MRRECLDHLLVLGETHLRRALTEYSTYFNRDRPHQGLQQRIPDPPEADRRWTGPVREEHIEAVDRQDSQAHAGEYAAVSTDGRVILAPTTLEAVERAANNLGPGTFTFRVGEAAVGKWLSQAGVYETSRPPTAAPGVRLSVHSRWG